MINYWEEGYNDFYNLEIQYCPYSYGTPEAIEWLNGWQAAEDDEYEERKFALDYFIETGGT